MIPKALSILVFILASGAIRADNEIIGTIELTFDGQVETWYVLQSPEGLTPNALWLETGESRGTISVTAFESPDIELVRDERAGSAVPNGSAPALIVAIGFPIGASEQSYSLPIDQTEGPAVVMLMNDWSNPIDSMTLSDGPGEIRLDSIDASKDGPSTFSGTFTGALKNGEGDSRTIESGRFELEKVMFFERP